MITHALDPVLLDLGFAQVRWYGLFYVAGFLLAYWYLTHLSKRKLVPLSKDDVADLILYALVGVVVGARVVYMLVYNFPLFAADPLSLFAVWQGGLSFHGGLLGLVGAVWLFSRRRKVAFYDITDALVVPAAFGLMLGRVGNFINGELVGRVTDVAWCVDFSRNPDIVPSEGCRHPSQLYEAFYSLVIGISLILLRGLKLPKGTLTWTFVALYGLFRTLAEFFRQPDPQLGFILGPLSMGQLLSFPMFLVGVGMVWLVWKRK